MQQRSCYFEENII